MEGENFDIYGDLENFDFGEKLKEKNEEIESLTERLNQSVVVITELEQKNKKIKKNYQVMLRNTSSLLLTAKLEISRKVRDLNLLQQKIENKIFRRPNNFSVAIQTDATIHPSFTSSTASESKKRVEESKVDKLTIDSCDGSLVPVDVLSVAGNVRESINTTFCIPKKNPNARLVDMNDRTKFPSVVCVAEKFNDIQLVDIQEQQKNCMKKYHIPKKNPYARRFDIVEVVSNATQDDHSRGRNNIIESCEKVSSESRKIVIGSNRRIEGDQPNNSRKNDRYDQRKRTTAPYSLDKGRNKDRYANSDEQRCSVRIISNLKRSRDRDEGEERPSKLSRCRSKSNNNELSRSRSKSTRSRSKSARSRSKSTRSRSKSTRSRSKSTRSRSKSARTRSKSARSRSKSTRRRSNSTRIEEETSGDKLTEKANLNANDLKSENQERTKNVKTSDDVSLTEVADKELEAMLLAKTKILQNIDKEKDIKKKHKQIHKVIAQEEPRKKICLRDYKQRKSLPGDDGSNTAKEQCSEDPINSTNVMTSNSNNTTNDNFVVETLATLSETSCVSDVNQMKIIENDLAYEDVKSNVHPSATGNNQHKPTVVIPHEGLESNVHPPAIGNNQRNSTVVIPNEDLDSNVHPTATGNNQHKPTVVIPHEDLESNVHVSATGGNQGNSTVVIPHEDLESKDHASATCSNQDNSTVAIPHEDLESNVHPSATGRNQGNSTVVIPHEDLESKVHPSATGSNQGNSTVAIPHEDLESKVHPFATGSNQGNSTVAIPLEDLDSNVHPTATGNNQRNSTVVIPNEDLDSNVHSTATGNNQHKPTVVIPHEYLESNVHASATDGNQGNSTVAIPHEDLDSNVHPTATGNNQHKPTVVIPHEYLESKVHPSATGSNQGNSTVAIPHEDLESKVHPSATGSNQRNSTVEVPDVVVPSIDLTSLSSDSSIDGVTTRSETTVIENNKLISNSTGNRLENNDNSNSAMDIDYELTANSTYRDEINATNDQNTIPLPVNDQEDASAKNSQSSVAHSNTSPQKMPTTTVENVVENQVPETHEIDENKDTSNVSTSMNSSFERHVLSKTMEYTVQDVGHEVHIYLTKKRKKSRKVRIAVEI